VPANGGAVCCSQIPRTRGDRQLRAAILVACGTTLCNASAVALQICTSSLVRVISMLVEFTRTYSIDDAVAAYGYEWSCWWSLGGRKCREAG
jgi:hypothetical protein